MTIESKTTESAKDRQLGPLASLVRAAEPLEELTVAERERIRRRLRAHLLPGHRHAAGFRWSMALAALALLLVGGGVFAAAGHFGLIHWPRETKLRSESEPEASPARRRPGRAARPRSTPASQPTGTVSEDAVPPPQEMAGSAKAAITPLPVVALVATPPSSGPEPGATPRLAASVPSSQAARPARAPRVAPVSATSAAAAGIGKSISGQPLSSPPKPIAAIAEPVVALPSSGRVAVLPTGPRLAMAAPGTSGPAMRAIRAPDVAPALSVESATGVANPMNGQAMLGQALRSLRSDRDPAGALAILARHAALFPQSPLASERSALEVEALLALGRNDEALARLDRMSLDYTPRSAERHVVRGELRARARRWREAAADFDQALAQGKGTSAWKERALWGRAVTRTHAGDEAGARADLQRYLQLYPQGRFASGAARLLAARR